MTAWSPKKNTGAEERRDWNAVDRSDRCDRCGDTP